MVVCESLMGDPRAVVHRTIVVVDVEGFGTLRRIPDQVAVRHSLYTTLQAVFSAAEIPWAGCYQEDRGDGVLILAPADVPKGRFVEILPLLLSTELRRLNSVLKHDMAPVRLRMAMHAGEVQYDDHGVAGPSINLTFRLIEATELKSALAASSGVLAVIVSAWFYDEVIQHSHIINQADYRPIHVAIKETDTTAWIHLPGDVLSLRTAPFHTDPQDTGPAADEDDPLTRALRELARTLHRQWSDEAAIRNLHQPQPLCLTWTSTRRPVAAHPAAILGDHTIGGRPTRLRLHGGIDQVVEVLNRLPHKQLVVLGEPGSGKTVLAILLTLALLRCRSEQVGLVPILLSPSSWDPRAEHLHTWLSRRLIEDYPALRNRRAFGPDAATRLLTDGRTLPILDGLDELPAELRTVALAALNHATHGAPIVITCRSTEYEAAVTTSGSVLTTAAVIELEPAGVTEVIRYLSAASPSSASRWEPVFGELRTTPSGHVAEALSSPLIAALMRTIYSGETTDPGELLDPDRFPDQHTIEQHALDAFILTTYSHHPPPPGRHRPTPSYPPDQARAWLSFLAEHLARRATRDLAWWQLYHALPRRSRILVGVILQLVGGLACGLGIGLCAGFPVGPAAGAAGGLVVGLLATPPSHPRQINAPLRGRRRHRARTVLTGLIIGLTTGTVVGLGLGVGLAAGLAGGLIAGLGIGIMEWLDMPADTIRSPSPISTLRADRTISLLGILADFGLGLVVGFFAGPGIALATGILIGCAAGLVLGLARRLLHWSSAAFSASAWGWFLVSRSSLALQGRLPWRLMQFLHDAHHRGVLRQTGAVYQFRHARLQDQLARQTGSH